MSRVLRCECGTEIVSSDEDELVALAMVHAQRAHTMVLDEQAVRAQVRAVTAASRPDPLQATPTQEKP